MWVVRFRRISHLQKRRKLRCDYSIPVRLNRASEKGSRWLRDILNREGWVFGTHVEMNEDGALTLAN